MTARLVRITAALLAAVVLTTGCSLTREPTMTQDEAVALVAQRAQEAFQQLPDGATLKQRLHQPDIECTPGHPNRTFVETNYDVDFPAGWPVEQSMTQLVDYWTANGYTIVRDNRSDSAPDIVVEKKTDGFHIGYLINPKPNGGPAYAVITSSSPCLNT